MIIAFFKYLVHNTFCYLERFYMNNVFKKGFIVNDIKKINGELNILLLDFLLVKFIFNNIYYQELKEEKKRK